MAAVLGNTFVNKYADELKATAKAIVADGAFLRPPDRVLALRGPLFALAWGWFRNRTDE